VNLNGSDIYLSPGVPYTPFGTLPWFQTDVWGLRLKTGGNDWIRTPSTRPDEAITHRVAKYRFEGDDLKGEVRLTFHGVAAAWLRLKNHRADNTSRKQFLINELGQFIVAATDVQLVKEPLWEDPDRDLEIEYIVTLHGLSAVGKNRLMVSDYVFSFPEGHALDSLRRENPIYFNFPYITQDEILIDLPVDWKISSMPEPVDQRLNAADFTSSSRLRGHEIYISKQLAVKQILVVKEQYTEVRYLFKKADDARSEKIILER
jgi:hypothetical protein